MNSKAFTYPSFHSFESFTIWRSWEIITTGSTWSYIQWVERVKSWLRSKKKQHKLGRVLQSLLIKLNLFKPSGFTEILYLGRESKTSHVNSFSCPPISPASPSSSIQMLQPPAVGRIFSNKNWKGELTKIEMDKTHITETGTYMFTKWSWKIKFIINYSISMPWKNVPQ